MLLAGLLWVCLNSCALLDITHKTKRTEKIDSISIHKVDTTHVTNNYFQNHSDSSWWREIINLIPKVKDTTINNTTVPVNNYYPAQIIREGGTLTKNDIARLIDSMNRAKSDTTHISAQINSKDKESKPPFLLIAFVGVGFLFVLGVAVLVILYKLHISIKSLKP